MDAQFQQNQSACGGLRCFRYECYINMYDLISSLKVFFFIPEICGITGCSTEEQNINVSVKFTGAYREWAYKREFGSASTV